MKLNNTEHTVHSLEREVDKSRRVAHTGFSWVKKGQTLDLSTIPPTPGHQHSHSCNSWTGHMGLRPT